MGEAGEPAGERRAGALIFAQAAVSTARYLGSGSRTWAPPTSPRRGRRARESSYRSTLKCPSCVTPGSAMPPFENLGEDTCASSRSSSRRRRATRSSAGPRRARLTLKLLSETRFTATMRACASSSHNGRSGAHAARLLRALAAADCEVGLSRRPRVSSDRDRAVRPGELSRDETLARLTEGLDDAVTTTRPERTGGRRNASARPGRRYVICPVLDGDARGRSRRSMSN